MTISVDEFKEMLPRLQIPVQNFIAKKISDAHEAQDILQDTIVRALEKIGELRRGEKVVPWMRRIARNLIYDHLKEKRDTRWSTLSEEALVARGKKRKNLLEEFDEITRELALFEQQGTHFTIITLHYVMGWKAKELAPAFGSKVNTISKIIRNFPKKLQRRRRKLDPDKEVILKSRVANILNNVARFPLYTNKFRDVRLGQEALALGKLTAMQFPENMVALGNAAALSFLHAHHKSYPDEMVPPITLREFNRERWDPELLAEAVSYYKRFKKLNPPPLKSLCVDNLYLKYTARSIHEMDLKRIYENYLKYNALDTFAPVVFHIAFVLAELKGPLKAARYMERFPSIYVGYPRGFFEIALFYFRARRWMEARKNLKKALKLPLNEIYRDFMKAKVTHCMKMLNKNP